MFVYVCHTNIAVRTKKRASILEASHAASGITSAGPPREVEGRFIHDFLYVGQTIGSDLPEADRVAMVAFFERELRTSSYAQPTFQP